jgi:hypothetical protein
MPRRDGALCCTRCCSKRDGNEGVDGERLLGRHQWDLTGGMRNNCMVLRGFVLPRSGQRDLIVGPLHKLFA